jgi:hypothetical protein
MSYRFNSLLFIVLFSGHCFAQHVEYNFGAGSGLYHYLSDKSHRMSLSYSFLNTSLGYRGPQISYMNDPNGEKSGFSFQFFAGVKKVTIHNLLWGIDVEFQSLQSKKNILYVFAYDSSYASTGHCSLTNRYIDLFPYIGKRILIKNMYFDITGGIELAMGFFNSQQFDHAVINSTGQILQADIKLKGYGHNAMDGRFRLQSLTRFDKHWGILLGYAWGLTNLDGQNDPNHSHSRYASIGINYVLQKK